jgi:hypothetical protein
MYGNEMYKPSYGKSSEMGWNVDHSKPQSKGGTDHLNNLHFVVFYQDLVFCKISLVI